MTDRDPMPVAELRRLMRATPKARGPIPLSRDERIALRTLDHLVQRGWFRVLLSRS